MRSIKKKPELKCPKCGDKTIREGRRRDPIWGKPIFYVCARCGYTGYRAEFEG